MSVISPLSAGISAGSVGSKTPGGPTNARTEACARRTAATIAPPRKPLAPVTATVRPRRFSVPRSGASVGAGEGFKERFQSSRHDFRPVRLAIARVCGLGEPPRLIRMVQQALQRRGKVVGTIRSNDETGAAVIHHIRN